MLLTTFRHTAVPQCLCRWAEDRYATVSGHSYCDADLDLVRSLQRQQRAAMLPLGTRDQATANCRIAVVQSAIGQWPFRPTTRRSRLHPTRYLAPRCAALKYNRIFIG